MKELNYFGTNILLKLSDDVPSTPHANSKHKNAIYLNDFKSGIQKFKSDTISLGKLESGNFWYLSYEELKRIESANYLGNKIRHNEYLRKIHL